MTASTWADRFADAATSAAELAAVLRADPELARARTTLGNTLLHEACWHKRTDLVETLLDAGADPNARGDLGRTPLHCAVNDAPAAAALPLVERLLARGAVRDLEDDLGFLPAEWAAREIWDDRTAVLALLGPAAPQPPDPTPIALARLLDAFRDGRPLDVAAATARLTGIDRACVDDLARILTEIAGTSWSAAARALLASSFKPAHIHRWFAAYRR
ncbi:MAG: ankyrin repeat domain-containing protein [Deltaproteobacteria bacterium]|nr:ankyrin repeat domain-containing protein [Deltaproteobacteria bacterium]